MNKMYRILMMILMVMISLGFTSKAEAAVEKKAYTLEVGSKQTVTFSDGVSATVKDKSIAKVTKNKSKFTIEALAIGNTTVTIKNSKKSTIGTITLDVKKDRPNVYGMVVCNVNERTELTEITTAGYIKIPINLKLYSGDKVTSGNSNIVEAKISKGKLILNAKISSFTMVEIKSQTGRLIYQIAVFPNESATYVYYEVEVGEPIYFTHDLDNGVGLEGDNLKFFFGFDRLAVVAKDNGVGIIELIDINSKKVIRYIAIGCHNNTKATDRDKFFSGTGEGDFRIGTTVEVDKIYIPYGKSVDFYAVDDMKVIDTDVASTSESRIASAYIKEGKVIIDCLEAGETKVMVKDKDGVELYEFEIEVYE